MKPYTLFLQGMVVLVGLCVLAFLLSEPHFEGRNVGATVFEIYFKDPFLMYVYIASIPFFVALSRVFMFLGYVREGSVFSEKALTAWRTVGYCARITAVAIFAAAVYIAVTARMYGEDAAGVMVLFGVAFLLSLTAAAISMVWQHVLQSPKQS